MDPLDAVSLTLPTLPQGVVRRPRLEERLDAGVRGPLTLVSAPAGTGKTVAVLSWMTGVHAPSSVVWLSLDDSTMGPGRVLDIMAKGLARHGVGVGAETPRALAGGEDLDAGTAPSVLSRILAHHEPVILVLDCDCVLGSDVATALDSLVRHCDGRLRLVLLSREDPLLPLHRYRLAGTVVEVRMADLAFTADEAHDMLAGMGVEMSTAAMHAVVGRTRGWAAGLRMAAMSLAHREDREAAAFKLAGDTGTMAEYLLAEVLDRQPPSVRQLLLETSVVDVLRPGLAAALAGPHADRTLSFLVHGNAFLEELGDAPGSYRYHQLFRELLRAQLAYESPARYNSLHRKAAAWLAANNLVIDAVRHAVKVGDWEMAASYAVDDLSAVTLLMPGSTQPLREALAKMPRAASGPAASIVSAAAAVAAGDSKGALSAIRKARRSLGGASARSWPAGELALAVVELVHARQTGDSDAAVVAAATATELLPLQSSDRLASHPEVRTAIQSNLGAALLQQGRLDAAAEAFAAAAEAAKEAGTLAVTGVPLTDALGHGALIAALRGELKRASALAQQAIHTSSLAGIVPVNCSSAAEATLAYVATERSDLTSAGHHAAKAAACCAARCDPLPQAMLALASARRRRAGGDIDAAVGILEEVAGDMPAWLADRLYLEKASMLAADGQSARASDAVRQLSAPASAQTGLLLVGARPTTPEDVATPALPLSSHGMPVADRIDSLVITAVRLAEAGSDNRAVRYLDHALRLAAPELSRRCFRQAPREVWQLLSQHEELLTRHAWLTDMNIGDTTNGGVPRARYSARASTAGPAHLYAPLTDKEQEVLGHLAALLTTEEIASAMFISVNTVRTHVRNILRKFSASRRNEAVRRARELNVIPS